MEQSGNFIAPEASTDERASSPEPQAADSADWPEFATREEAAAFWQGVKRGVRDCGRDLSHPHLPADFALNLTRDGAGPDLTSGKPLDVWPHNPDNANNHGNTSHGPVALSSEVEKRADRHNGFTHAAEQLFLRTLAGTGVVADACRATGLTRQAAYARRHSAAGRAFALAWDAALLLARDAIADDVMGRSRHGVIERVYRNGELVAERHKYDNRLTMAVLARLDRLAEGQGQSANGAAPVARAIAQEFDQFLALLPEGVAAAERFLSVRFPAPGANGEPELAEEPPACFGNAPEPGSEAALLALLGHYEERGVGLPAEISIDDLDPDEMADWTPEQWDRAKASGFLAMLTEAEWPEAARDGSADGTDGMCQMRQHYLAHHAPALPDESEEEDDFGGCYVWETDGGEWLTDFPPPAGFNGYEEGTPGSYDYKRELSPEEQAVIDADLALEREKEEERLPALEAARRRYFELDDEPPEAA